MLQREVESKKLRCPRAQLKSYTVKMSAEWRYSSTHLPIYPWGNSSKYRVARRLATPRGRSARYAGSPCHYQELNPDCFTVENVA